MEINVLIGLLCSIAGILISYAVFQHNMKKDSNSEGRETGTVLAELGYIKGGVEDIKAEQREQRKTNTEIITRLTKVEASAKQAHHRLDRIEGRKE